MPMLTVRLTDEEMARLKEIAAGTSVAKVVREWIEASHLLIRGESLPVAAVSRETLPDQAPLPGGTTAIVDGQYERHERTVKGWAPGGGDYIAAYVQSTNETVLIPAPTMSKPAFLAAPDEDCVCGHDRHSFHLAGPCTGFVGKVRCDCTGFLADLGF